MAPPREKTMKAKERGIPDDDRRNPQYWERRIGYPAATRSWLDCKENGGTQHGELVFSGESFCRGFDLTAGNYYQLRKKAISLLLEEDLFKKDWGREWKQLRWHVTRLEKTIKDEPLLNIERLGVKPQPFWIDQMVHEFIIMNKKWMAEFETQVRNDSYHIPGRWSHGEESNFEKWQWKGNYQYQHLSFEISRGTDSSEDVVFDAYRIIPYLDGVTYSPEDVEPEVFRWNAFANELKQSAIAFDITKMVVSYLLPESDTQITVQDDDTLQAAIIALRNANNKKRTYTIRFAVVDRTDPVWTASTYDSGEDRRPKGKRKRDKDGGGRKHRKTAKGARLVTEEY